MAAASMQRRVTTAVVVAFVTLLIGLFVAVDATFTITTNRSEAAVLADHVQLARDLAAHNAAPAMLVARLETRSTEVRLELANGTVLGRLSDRAIARTSSVHTITLPNRSGPLAGARLSMLVNGGFLKGVQTQLRNTLLVVALAALLLLTAIVPFVVRRALKPLDTMAETARGIAAGRRGDRIGTVPESGELERLAVAFDGMLDSLEGAEQRALASEETTRRFVADAAHELRTPIAGLSALALAAQDQSTSPGDRQRLLGLVGVEAHRAGRLVDDLLELARLDAGLQLDREPTRLRSLIEGCIERVRVLNPDLSFELSGDATALVDAHRISQVVGNLLNNACSHSRPGGRVRVEISTASGAVEIAVSDMGSGVPAGDRERIFDRLVRLDGSRGSGREGTGLGLTIARGIARSHGGDLVCAEPDGVGAKFVLTLPS